MDKNNKNEKEIKQLKKILQKLRAIHSNTKRQKDKLNFLSDMVEDISPRAVENKIYAIADSVGYVANEIWNYIVDYQSELKELGGLEDE